MAKVHSAPFALPDDATEGVNRNATLTQYAGKLRYAGTDSDTILIALHALVAPGGKYAHWTPQEGELERIATSAESWPPGPSVTQPLPLEFAAADVEITQGDDAELAGVIAAPLEQLSTYRIVYDLGDLHAYNPECGLWDRIPRHRVINALIDLNHTQYVKMSKGGKPQVETLCVSDRMTKAVYSILCESRTQEGFFNANPQLVCANGVVIAKDGAIYVQPLHPDARALHAASYPYVAGAQCAEWYEFLAGVWNQTPDDVAALTRLACEWIGVALLGMSTHMQQHLFLTGGGHNGKSTFLDVLRALFDNIGVTAIAPQSFADRYDLADLAKARINIVPDVGEGELKATAPLKSALGGDVMRARPIYGKPFDFRARAGCAFAAQYLPPVHDTSHGFWRRWIVLPFTRQFTQAERILGLSDKLAVHVPAIASICLDAGAQALQRGHYVVPDVCVRALARWRFEADTVAAFVERACTPADVAEGITAAEFRRAISVHWALTGERAISDTLITRKLRDLGVRDAEGKYALRLVHGTPKGIG